MNTSLTAEPPCVLPVKVSSNTQADRSWLLNGEHWSLRTEDSQWDKQETTHLGRTTQCALFTFYRRSMFITTLKLSYSSALLHFIFTRVNTFVPVSIVPILTVSTTAASVNFYCYTVCIFQFLLPFSLLFVCTYWWLLQINRLIVTRKCISCRKCVSAVVQSEVENISQ